MKLPVLIVLCGSLILPLRGQVVKVVLPDTIMQVSSIPQVTSVLTDRLTSEGRRGRLGSVYRLESVVMEEWSESSLTLKYHSGDLPVPPPDTIVAYNSEGAGLPNLVTFLRVTDPSPGGFLQSASQPAWRVMDKSYFSRGEGYGIRYSLEDVSRKTVQVLAAYDEQGSQAGRLVGEITLDLPNFLGTLRYLHVQWRRLNPATQTIDLTYAEPHLPLLPLGAQVSFFQDLRDTLYLQRDVKVQLISLPAQGWSSALGVGMRTLQVTPHGRDQGLVPYSFRNVNLSLERMTLDHPVNPSRGYRIGLALEGGTVTGVEVNPRAALGRGQFNATWTGSLARLTLAQEVQVRGLAALEFTPQLADFGRYGGSTTLRGYREDQFLVPWGVVSRTELRFRTGPATRTHLFLDTGILADVDRLAAVGFGLLLKAGQNLIQIDLAWNRDDNFRTGKVHLRLINFLSMTKDGRL
ncbi:MAG: BamA/TamA family outer membrane protein [Fidelibacterota bacterium]|nr:MAG: BamA/TamA family outer membrane protein [Candidatus Neomarinimicrobiota bacterium]